ncbi:MAG: universal stress protein, partial [Bacteroidales bacterium]
MKNIVVGIDFSKNSLNAMRHAVAIALKNNGKIHLIWVKTPGASESIVKDNANAYTMKAEERLIELVNECKTEAPNCSVHYVILEGKPATEITTYASNITDSIIVIGTH